MESFDKNPHLLNSPSSELLIVSSHYRKVDFQWINQTFLNPIGKKWIVSADRNIDGIWAGARSLFAEIIDELQLLFPDLVSQYDYEITHVFPILRRIINVRYLPLTDIDTEEYQVRYHPADRSMRIIQGLVDLFSKWYQLSNQTSVLIIVNDYDESSYFGRLFWIEIMRRKYLKINIRLVIVTANSSLVETDFESTKHNVIKTEIIPCRSDQAMSLPDINDEHDLEYNLPQIISYYLQTNQPDLVAIYQQKASLICTKRGFYQDGIWYGLMALNTLEATFDEHSEDYGQLVEALYTCYISLDNLKEAFLLMEEKGDKILNSMFVSKSYYMLAMLYARYFPIRDFNKALTYLEDGLSYINNSDISSALKCLTIASNRRGASLIKYRQGDYEEAINLSLSSYQQLNNYFGENKFQLHQSILLYTIAQVYIAIKDYQEAIKYFTRIIQIDPSYSEYYNERGNVYQKMGNLKMAIADYQMAIKVSPPYPEVWTNLAQCYRQIGDSEKGLEAYSRSLDLDQNQTLALAGRAECYEMLGEIRLAINDYTQSLKLDSQQPLVLANRAILYYELKQFTASIYDLNRAIEIDVENYDLYRNRAVVFIDLESTDKAIRDLKTYLRLNLDAEDRTEVENQIVELLTLLDE